MSIILGTNAFDLKRSFLCQCCLEVRGYQTIEDVEVTKTGIVYEWASESNVSWSFIQFHR